MFFVAPGAAKHGILRIRGLQNYRFSAFWAGSPATPQNLGSRLRDGNFGGGETESQNTRILGNKDISPKKARILGHSETGGYESTTYIASTKAASAAWWHPHKGGPADS